MKRTAKTHWNRLAAAAVSFCMAFSLLAGTGMPNGSGRSEGFGGLTAEAVTSGTWKMENGKWYFYVNGVKKTGWVETQTDRWFYLDPNNGGAMVTGTRYLDGKYYYFKETNNNDLGLMVMGWYQHADGWRYYSKEYGSRGKRLWDWQQIDGYWYFLSGESSGLMITGWKQMGAWFYFTEASGGAKGRMVTGSQHLYSGNNNTGTWKGYYFDADGHMRTFRFVFDSPTANDLKISSGYMATAGRPDTHKGLDLVSSLGKNVNNAENGTVIKVETNPNSSGGLYVVVKTNVKDKSGNYVTVRYLHLNSTTVAYGQTVSPGTKVGTVGNTGQSFGTHLHVDMNTAGSTSPTLAQTFDPKHVFHTVTLTGDTAHHD